MVVLRVSCWRVRLFLLIVLVRCFFAMLSSLGVGFELAILVFDCSFWCLPLVFAVWYGFAVWQLLISLGLVGLFCDLLLVVLLRVWWRAACVLLF